MKRIYFIANSYDGAYFVLTDNVEEYFQRIAAYVLNLEQSAKLNNYSFGSVEMSEKEYEDYKNKAQNLEQSQVKKTQELKEEQTIIEEKEVSKPSLEMIESEEEDQEEFPVPPRKPLPSERPHLRLV